MQRGLSQFSHTRELSASQLRRSIYLFRRGVRAKIEPDGSLSWVHSHSARKLLFGRMATEVFKIQSGVKIGIRPQDVVVRATPTSVSFTPRGSDKVLAAHSARLLLGECEGWVRAVRLTNRTETVARLRVVTLHDPTSLNFRRDRDAPGEIGVNAFNRHDQVVMDDVGDTTGVRVVGFSPRPSVIYMTKDRSRATELLGLGELPESSSGMSGSVIILTQQDVDLAPGATTEVRSSSVYNPSSLESALGATASPLTEESLEANREPGPRFASSNSSANFAFEWAKAALSSIEGESNLGERLWSGIALALLRGESIVELAEWGKHNVRKDGMIRYSEPAQGGAGMERAGPMETSLYLIAICTYLASRAPDEKTVKKWYPRLKKVADGLSGAVSQGLLASSTEAPDGWRRRLAAGFPSGHTSEVDLVAVRALREASAVARLLGRGSDSASFHEMSVRLLDYLNQKLRDAETGTLALNVDTRGVVHKETTIDQAVGLSYFSPDQNLASSVVHRLLEKDFETGWGPRTVPNSNNLYYHPTYAEGQLGGYWTRAAISHAILAFATGYPGIGSAQLEKVARLVQTEAERLGGMPGEFPYWIDAERRQILSTGSDPVAASRFVEAVLFGEAGLTLSTQGASFKVPEASKLRWMLLDGLDLDPKGSIFIGRSSTRSFVASSFGAESVAGSPRSGGVPVTASFFPESQRLEGVGFQGLAYWDAASTLLCLGNTEASPCSGAILAPLNSKSFTTSLFAEVEELQPETGLWTRLKPIKLGSRPEIKVDLRPSSWKAFRLTASR